VAKKTVHHMDFDTLVEVNREVVDLTKEPHAYTSADEERLRHLLGEVEGRANNAKFDEAVGEKSALLIFKIASGQHFKGGNKRTALVAALVFLRKNEREMDISNPALVEVVDKVGMAAAGLDDVYSAMEDLVKKGEADRKSWSSVLKKAIDDNKDFLIEEGTEQQQ
jgi:prophage maintenance system killer protein